MFKIRRNRLWHFRKKNHKKGYNFYKNSGALGASLPRHSRNRQYKQFRIQRNKFSFAKIIFFISLLFIIYVAYYFFYSENFLITNIKIEGRQNISEYALKNIIENQLKEPRFLIFKQNNLIFFNKTLAKQNIKNSYVLEELKITKKFPHTLKISLKEKISTIIWAIKNSGEDNYYYLDLKGIVLGKIPISEVEKIFSEKKSSKNSEKNKENSVDIKKLKKESNEKNIISNTQENDNSAILPIIYNLSGEEAAIGEEVVNAKVINFIIELKQKFPQIIKGKNIKYFTTLKKHSTRVNLVTKEGWEVYFESSKNLDEQLNNLKLAIQKKIKDLSKIQYIDLRFNERIYYK